MKRLNRYSFLLMMCMGLLSMMACSSKEKQNDESEQNTKIEQPMSLKVMSFNMRMATDADGANKWSLRVDSVQKLISTEKPDIVGGQEVLKGMLDDWQRFAPEYAYIGVGREDGATEGEYSPILYRKDRFRVVEKGWHWLSETPDKPGLGWDAACNRMVVWAILQDTVSGKSLAVFNTHFDHMGEVARLNSSHMLLETVNAKRGDLPAVVTGDFNANPETEVIKAILNEEDPNHLTDTRALTTRVSGPSYTFHDYGRTPVAEREIIDYIFIKGDVQVNSLRVIAEGDKPGHVYYSDHHAVIAELEI